MPFKSAAQRAWMWANKPEMAKEWEAHTPDSSDLPDRAKSSEKPARPQLPSNRELAGYKGRY